MWKGEFVLRLNHVDLALKNSLSVTGRGKSYEHPTISKLPSHHPHLRAVAIAVYPPGTYFKTTIHNTLHSGQMPFTQMDLPRLLTYLK